MSFVRLLTVAVMGLALFQVCCRRVDGPQRPAFGLARTDFHGWARSGGADHDYRDDLREGAGGYVELELLDRMRELAPGGIKGAESPAGRGP